MKTDKLENYFASCPKGIEELLRDELTEIGAEKVRMTVAGVSFSANRQQLYRALLSTRFANRILWQVSQDKAETADEVYSAVYQLAWEEYISEGLTFVVDFIGTNQSINNSQFGALKVKDAIVDRFKKLQLERPNIDKRQPDVRINVRLTKGKIIVSLDMSGDSLHKRGYRVAQGDAPLKENLAAAILVRTGWPKLVADAEKENRKIALVDPMCGSGTFLIEGFLLAANYAPGLLRDDFSLGGFACRKLPGFDHELWHAAIESLKNEVRDVSSDNFPIFIGRDSDAKAVKIAQQNVENSPAKESINFQVGNMQSLTKEEIVSAVGVESLDSGLLVCNPPYGQRLGEVEALRDDYRELGQVLKQELPGWKAAIFTSNADLAKEMRLRAANKYKLFNGKIEAELHLFDILSGDKATLRKERDLSIMPMSEGAQMVANRLQKNDRKLEPWRKKNNISCYRVYDADMPEYAAAIDVYDGQFHIQEYQAPKSVDASKARQRFHDIQHAVVQSFGVNEKEIACKTRMKQKGSSQYEKTDKAKQAEKFSKHDKRTFKNFFTVKEGQANIEVNLQDYLDTGLFLDHRPLRRKLFETSKGKSFLNLFCYTATASVQAILGGATSSVSVDMSNTYLDWARRNYDLNNIRSDKHQLHRADCVEWLKKCRQGFDVIMLDPPSFSNSKFTSTVLDIQKDHASMISRCVDILKPGGVLYFSCNLRSFKLDEKLSERFNVKDISSQTLDPDFERNKKIHYCWEIRA